MSIARRLRVVIPGLVFVATAWLANGANPVVGDWSIEGFQVLRQVQAAHEESQGLAINDELTFNGDHAFHSAGFVGRWKPKSSGIECDIAESFGASLVVSGATNVKVKSARFFEILTIPGVAIEGRLDAKAKFRAAGVKTKFTAMSVFSGVPAGA